MKNKIIFVGLVFVLFAGVAITTSAATTTPTIKVVSPNEGEVWKTGTIKNKKPSSSSSLKPKSSRSSATPTVYMLKINKSGKGYVSVEDNRITCGKDCEGEYKAGDMVKLRAVPNGGYVFKKFTPEKECLSIYSDGFGFNDGKLIKQAFAYKEAENVVCVTTMNKNKTITAVFEKIKK